MLEFLKRLFSWWKPKPKVTFSNPEGRPKKQIDLEQMHLLKQQGKSNREIARILGCSEGTIRKRLK